MIDETLDVKEVILNGVDPLVSTAPSCAQYMVLSNAEVSDYELEEIALDCFCSICEQMTVLHNL